VHRLPRVLLAAALAATAASLPVSSALASTKKSALKVATSTTTTAAAPATTTTIAAPATTTTTAAPATTTTTAAPATTTTTAAPITPILDTVTNITSETFDSLTWWALHGLAARPWHTGVLAAADGNRFLRTQIAQGTHDGTSFFLPTGTADHVRLTYRLRVDKAFDATTSANDVKLPGFGNPSMTLLGVCLSGCGGAGADGITGYSARVDVANTNIPGFYVYDLPAQAHGRGARWAAPRLSPDVWHTVQLEIAMNTPGVADGLLKATLDGQPVFSQTRLVFRTVPTLHVGNAWFDVYFGGSGVAPATTNIDIDDVVVDALS
jgi:hypothetical protein